MKIHASVHLSPNSYGFGSDLHLDLKKGKKERSFWLGQTAKYFGRALGWEIGDAINQCETETGSRDVEKKEVNAWLTEKVLQGMISEEQDHDEELKRLFEVKEPWTLCIE